jgi:hypothetical protein
MRRLFNRTNTTMRTRSCILGLGAFAFLATTAGAGTPSKVNTLTAAEQRAGWRLLFDGQTTAGWRAYGGKSMPPSWKVVHGALVSVPGSPQERGDIVTLEQFDNFELTLEWKMAPGGNSGLQYRVSEDSKNPWDSGPEYQIVDHTSHEDGLNPLSSASGCYAVYAPSKDLTRPVGQWNKTRLVANGSHVEHWLNGRKVVSYEVGSKEWLVRVKTSKFINSKTYGRAPKGHLCLQDYGFPIEFRNIKLRPLPAPGKK